MSPWGPLRGPLFRMVWTLALVANVCTWMNDVSSAWMMSTLTQDPLWIGLVQTAAMLPVFLLGLPSGALADNLDRKRFLLVTQLWSGCTSLVLGLTVFLGLVTPHLLLLFVFLSGIGLAMRLPVLAALLPEVVPRTQLPSALALNAVSMNASRIIGPVLAGAITASLGSAWVFGVNALLSLLTVGVLWRWKRPHTVDPLGREGLSRAMRVGLQYVGHSRRLKGVLLRIGLFFLCTSALMAMLPLLAKQVAQDAAWAYTLLVAAMGLGAIGSATWLPRLRQRCRSDHLVLGSTAVQVLGMVGMAWADMLWLALVCMALGGGAWITVGNTLSVESQLGLPDWVRARGMSVSQMAVMGASALGAALWGQVATWTSVGAALLLAAPLLMAGMVALHRLWPLDSTTEDLSPRRVEEQPQAMFRPPAGRVLMEIEYRVQPGDVADFLDLMLDECRSNRLRHGAVAWELKQDLTQAGRFVECVLDASWRDHLRHFERLTASDLALRERRLSFHMGQPEPEVRRYVLK